MSDRNEMLGRLGDLISEIELEFLPDADLALIVAALEVIDRRQNCTVLQLVR